MAKKKPQLPVQIDLFCPTDFLVIDPSVEHVMAIARPQIDATVSMIRYGILHPDTVFGHLGKVGQSTGGEKYVKWTMCGVDTMTTPKRIFSFENQRKCVCCGREGNAFFIERHVNDTQFQYLNLYAILPNEIVLMTVDHILPDSMGGRYDDANFQTMCRPCNQSKKNIMSAEEVALVRADPKKYCKSWVHVPFLHALLDLQDMMRNATGDHATKLTGVFDKYRRMLKHNTAARGARTITTNLRNAIDEVNGVARPKPKPVRPSWIKRTAVGGKVFAKDLWQIFVRARTDIGKARRKAFAR